MRVLLVEDERNLAEVTRRGLVREGFVVDVAHDGLTGQWLAGEYAYDALVLDIMLPGRNGYDIVRNLRQAQVWTPILMLTAKDGDYDQADAFELGADDYLIKPFSFVVLIARLRALARRGGPERPVTLVVGDIVLDPNTREVTCCGERVELTAREYAVLHYFMRNPDTVLSKTQILDNVWDADFDGSPNIIEVYVGYLRRKLDTPFGRESLLTVRGSGYRLRPTSTRQDPPSATG